LRQHASLEQRRFASPRRADHDDKARASLRPARVELFDNGTGLVIAAEKNRGVSGLKGVDAGIG
jgi:hypothetical protein